MNYTYLIEEKTDFFQIAIKRWRKFNECDRANNQTFNSFPVKQLGALPAENRISVKDVQHDACVNHPWHIYRSPARNSLSHSLVLRVLRNLRA